MVNDRPLIDTKCEGQASCCHPRSKILSILCEAAAMRSATRLANKSISTVLKLLEDASRFCGLPRRKGTQREDKPVQVDEIWSFTVAKQKNVAGGGGVAEPIRHDRGQYYEALKEADLA
ncbi:hypothetical protein [Methylocella silvestris]|uniref:hypothetical protein n=1 Tax=Methylocella silvestris TaxID=199596 RepID=UPI0011AFB5BD|nr:hypothetical protein [Methylocella silvestris]